MPTAHTVAKELSRSNLPFPVVGIGASAGGVEAIKAMFQNMPAEMGAAFVVVMHLNPAYKSLLVELLKQYAPMPVQPITDNIEVEVNHIYILPAHHFVVLQAGHLRLEDIPLSRQGHHPIDHLFVSLALEQQALAIGVVLSGTLDDGSQGLRVIKEQGGLTLAQQPDSAKYDGMPQSAITGGVVDFILEPAAIAQNIRHYIHHYAAQQSSNGLQQVSTKLDSFLALLKEHTRYDFSSYKHSTLLRRIYRRMGLCQIEQVAVYEQKLRADPQEAHELLKDLLISVTGFFREAEVWEELRREVLPRLLLERESSRPLRVWVVGCASGEEAYSIAILLAETCRELNEAPTFQIFATDIDERALDVARKGIYPLRIEAEVTPERLARYFILENDSYRINKEIRDSIIFAAQNVINDPPYSNLDLITCRNLLIYYQQPMQQKIIALFHFALRQEAWLLLGNSETVGAHSLFYPVSKQSKIFHTSGAKQSGKLQFPIQTPLRPYLSDATPPDKHKAVNVLQTVEKVLLKRLLPATVVINRNLELLNLYGPIEHYLNLPIGALSNNFSEFIPEDLRIKLRTAIYKAIQSDAPVDETSKLQLPSGDYHYFRFVVEPLHDVKALKGLYLISFYPIQDSTQARSEQPISSEEKSVVLQLESELTATKQDLQTSIEELETSNEELKAANEEMMSMNEELQSANEELESAKEELQSLNEELSTVNLQLQDKLKEQEATNNDLENFLNSTDIATLFLDPSLCIRRFTPAIRQLFDLLASDIGRPISHLAPRFNDPQLQADAATVMEQLVPCSCEVNTPQGDYFERRILPFRTRDNKIEGVIITFANITRFKQSQALLAQNEARLEAAQALSLTGSWEWRANGEDGYWSAQYYRLLGYAPGAVPANQENFLQRVHPDDRAQVEQAIQQVIAGEQELKFDFRYVSVAGQVCYAHTTMQAAHKEQQRYVFGTLQDISERKLAEQTLQISEAKFRALVEASPIGIGLIDVDGHVIESNSALLDLLGYSSEELRDKTVAALTVSEDWANEQPLSLELAQGVRKQYQLRKRYLHKHGQPIWVDNCVATFVGTQQQNIATVSFVQDASDKVRNEAAEQQRREAAYQTLADSLPDIIVRFDRQQRYTFANRNIEKISPRGHGEFLGKTNRELNLPENWCALWENTLPIAFSSHKPIKTELSLMLEEQCRYYEVLLIPEIDDHNTADSVLIVIHDISAQREHAEQLGQAKNAAEAANRAKSTFLANMSHELRTPLNAIMGYAQLLEHDRVLPTREKKEARAIYDAGQYLLALINDILDLAKIEAGRFELQPEDFDVASFFNTFKETFKPLASQKSLRFNYEPIAALPHVLHADPRRLRQIINNLLSNALKFTDQGTITLVVAYQNAHLKLIVTDTGKGISESEQTMIFDAFTQIDDGDRYAMREGTGLGLAITRSLVKTMSGSIEVESKPGWGTTFRVELPLSRAEDSALALSSIVDQSQGAAKYVRTSGEGPLCALVVDDVKDNRVVLARILENCGFDVECASDGEECLEATQFIRPDVILLDLVMPRMSGLETVTALRQCTEFSQLPIIGVSAKAFTEDRQQALDAGFTDYLIKPVSCKDLQVCLAKYLPLTWELPSQEKSDEVSQEALAEEVTQLSLAQRTKLYHLLENGDINGLFTYLPQLEKTCLCPNFLAVLRRLVESFNLNAARHLLAQHFDLPEK